MPRFTHAICAILLLLMAPLVWADAQPGALKNIEEADGSPSCFGWQLKVSNTTLTDNGDGTCTVTTGGGGGNSFETLDVPAGTDPVADSSTDTLTITETSFLTLTGTAATDTIDITQVTTDLGTDGLIAANAVALGTDTTNNYVATIADAGNANITVANSGTETAAVTLNVVDVTCTGCLGTTEIAGLDISADTNLTAGRSLTLTDDDVLADAETYTDSKTLWFENPTAADDFKTIWTTQIAATITSITCESDQTVNFDLQVDDGSATGVNGSDIACTTYATDSTLAGDTTLAVGDRLDLALTSVSGTPTWVSITWAFTYDD